MNKLEVLQLMKKIVNKAGREHIWVNSDGDDVYENAHIDQERFVRAIEQEINEIIAI